MTVTAIFFLIWKAISIPRTLLSGLLHQDISVESSRNQIGNLKFVSRNFDIEVFEEIDFFMYVCMHASYVSFFFTYCKKIFDRMASTIKNNPWKYYRITYWIYGLVESSIILKYDVDQNCAVVVFGLVWFCVMHYNEGFLLKL